MKNYDISNIIKCNSSHSSSRSFHDILYFTLRCPPILISTQQLKRELRKRAAALEILYSTSSPPPPDPLAKKADMKPGRAWVTASKTNPLQTAEEQQLYSLADWGGKGGGGEDGGKRGWLNLEVYKGKKRKRRYPAPLGRGLPHIPRWKKWQKKSDVNIFNSAYTNTVRSPLENLGRTGPFFKYF